ncbi:MAG: 6,7-dimethyl-8-ribityllumazine synthase [Candidatus Latescibacteria bacterium]|jgi:6,7-dimethyl-8-ribityllumazine synthase|nr:6,7-dimethyl-8-ribityllumazine synthase [bacterium]MBD3424188.1 6,7-dimethyl-8-ribityllumazine synthase [Candidatus Latescibacterota bacterium]
MVEEKSGKLLGRGKSFGIVLGRFNELVTESLLQGALDCLKRHGVDEDDIFIYRVPGSFEIPQAAVRVTETDVDGVICIGTLIRGATPHFDILASQAVRDISAAGISSGKPVSFGVITADTQEQALERAGSKAGNKGWQAAQSALEMVNLFEDMQ